MSQPTPWTPDRPLDPGSVVLLEASAGTGKTWQIEGLVVRLVAVVGIPIDRLLIITFTREATADLRDRVRRRLVAARDALASDDAPEKDAVLALVWADPAERGLRRRRIQQALAEFDRAAISTIHGFCQRMLDQLAFESSQEPQLTVVADAGSVRDEIVADALAHVYAEASVAELARLADLGFTRGGLAQIVKLMTAPVALSVRPARSSTGGVPADPVSVVRQLQASLNAFRAFLQSPAGLVAARAFDDEATRPTHAKAKGRPPYKRYANVRGGVGPALIEWLDAGAPVDDRIKAPRNWGSGAHLRARWLADAGPPESFEGWPLCEAFDALAAAQDAAQVDVIGAFAAAVRERFEAELRRRAMLTYDGMLSRLAEAVGAERDEPRQPLTAAIRSRYDVALVDEFQDTDSAQWTVLRGVFADVATRLFLIGDPKQAIYSFRGADLEVYQDAAAAAERFALDRNFRTDEPLVEAANELWSRAAAPFGAAGIDYAEVSADKGVRISGLPDLATGGGTRPRRPLELRYIEHASLGLADTDDSPNKGPWKALAARLCAIECRRLLDARVRLRVGTDAEGNPVERALKPGDIAVLVPVHSEGQLTRDALRAEGIPAITGRREGVYGSDAVPWICALLDAVAAPGDERKARSLAVTPLFGWRAGDLLRGLAAPADGEDEETTLARERWQGWRLAIDGWSRNWSKLGFMGVLSSALAACDGVARLLGSVHGERAATDVRHLAELLHAEDRRTHPGPRGLLDWLRTEAAPSDTAADEGADQRAMRLESDANAVQIVTMHASKGLQYPVVLLPWAWSPGPSRARGGALRYRDRSGPEPVAALSLHASGSTERAAIVDDQKQAENDEQMRLLYVALTRAEHHCVAWLSAYDKGCASPIGRLILQGCNDKNPATHMALARQRLADLAASTDTIGAQGEPAPATPLPRWRLLGEVEPDLTPSPWPGDRRLGTGWLIASYSSMSRSLGFESDEPSARARTIGLPVEEGAEVDPGDEPAPSLAVDDALDAPVAAALLRGGTETGDWVHGVLEVLDFEGAAGSLGQPKTGGTTEELVARLGKQHARPKPEMHELFVKLLPGWLDTPLDAPMGSGPGGVPAGFALRQLSLGDRLDELAFDLRLGDGAHYSPSRGASGRVRDDAVRTALLDAIDSSPALGARAWLLASLAQTDDAERSLVPRVAGFLTGFIDLIFRVGGRGADARYFVSDYKSNRIHGALPPGGAGPGGGVLRGHYTRPWLEWKMDHAAYHLQALLYTVALHRLLRLRLGAAYDYDRHVGGHLYLFLLGMEGARTPRHTGAALGVYADRWPKRTVLGLDAALGGADVDGVRAAMDLAMGAGSRS